MIAVKAGSNWPSSGAARARRTRGSGLVGPVPQSSRVGGLRSPTSLVIAAASRAEWSRKVSRISREPRVYPPVRFGPRLTAVRDLHELAPAGESPHDAHPGARHAEVLGEGLDDGRVGPSLVRGRGDRHAKSAVRASFDAGAPRPGDDGDRDPRHAWDVR